MPLEDGIFFVRMKNFKWFFLAVLLGLPVAIYVFLQAFGQNEFDIPVYFEAGLSSTKERCEANYDQPYLVSYLIDTDSLFGTGESAKTIVYDLKDVSASDYQTSVNHQQSLFGRYGDDSRLLIISLSQDSVPAQHQNMAENHRVHILSQTKFLQFVRCILQLDLKSDSLRNQWNGEKMVLVDRSRRIRGFYNPSDMKEIDRLNTEIFILLNNQNEK